MKNVHSLNVEEMHTLHENLYDGPNTLCILQNYTKLNLFYETICNVDSLEGRDNLFGGNLQIKYEKLNCDAHESADIWNLIDLDNRNSKFHGFWITKYAISPSMTVWISKSKHMFRMHCTLVRHFLQKTQKYSQTFWSYDNSKWKKKKKKLNDGSKTKANDLFLIQMEENLIKTYVSYNHE